MKKTNIIKISLVFFLAAIAVCTTYTMQKLKLSEKKESQLPTLFNAIKKKNITLVRNILEQNVSAIDEKDEDLWTPLHYAANNYSSNFDITKLLIDKGAKHHLLNKYCAAPSDLTKNKEIKKLLLKSSLI